MTDLINSLCETTENITKMKLDGRDINCQQLDYELGPLPRFKWVKRA